MTDPAVRPGQTASAHPLDPVRGPHRITLRPIEITQPAGPSFF